MMNVSQVDQQGPLAFLLSLLKERAFSRSQKSCTMDEIRKFQEEKG